jgi:hypothetical protein
MCRIDGPIAAPSATPLPELADIAATLGREPAQPCILRLEPRQTAGAVGFGRFTISHRTTHPDRDSRHDEAKPRGARPM